ncbi:MAG: bifunctional protein-serine/threonine kinase/phosphatase [Gammaproteobacteria bacterium]|nr:bifunctional protein-serine/threonine kinase/phosphatase [Gammaproteobacteria bacterium]
MQKQLQVALGQYSDKGRKAKNQDFHGAFIPKEPMLSSKGIAIALADGISSSDVSQIASESAVKGFLEDYYCTSDAWSVKTSASRVILAVNSWLHSQTRQSEFCYDQDRGFVCTFSALILKSTTAHILHAGDTRVYRLRKNTLEQLTEDHRLWISKDKSYLNRALGVNLQLEVDYRNLSVEVGDVFIMATDGVYEFTSQQFIIDAVQQGGNALDDIAKTIVEYAYAQGSEDNLTLQIAKVSELPLADADEIYQQMTVLPFPPMLEARMQFDGFEIIREIHASSRSHVFLARDSESGQQVAIKIPSVDLRNEASYLERFLMEEWVARRVHSANILKPCLQTRKRNYIYLVTEYIEGQNLAQWMIDNPRPDIETVRGIIEQIANGLRAFHRLEMLHQDLRPNNIMIDHNGTVKIIDFGSTLVAAIEEIATPIAQSPIPGTAQFTAPEYFLGEGGTTRSDQFSLAVIAYQMLSGRLPYGTQVAKTRSKAAQARLRYLSVLDEDREIPAWVDDCLRKALHPNPAKRYALLSEFTFDLRHPNKEFLNKTLPPLMERNPLRFWQGVSAILTIIIVVLLFRLNSV